MQADVPSQTPMRRRAYVCAIAAWALSIVWLAVLLQRAPAQWSVAAFGSATALGAPAIAAVVVEIARSIWPRLSNWSDRTHFRWVAIWAVILFVVQFTGITMAIKSYVA
jgi:hypothetical protein